jgi:hypothetical protein
MMEVADPCELFRRQANMNHEMDYTRASKCGSGGLPLVDFFFVPAELVLSEAERLGATPFDVKGVELGHRGKECTFEAILEKYSLKDNPALILLARIVNGADTDNTLYRQPESLGLKAIADGFRRIGLRDDHEINAAERIVYDALYAHCQEMVRQGKVNGAFME